MIITDTDEGGGRRCVSMLAHGRAVAVVVLAVQINWHLI